MQNQTFEFVKAVTLNLNRVNFVTLMHLINFLITDVVPKQ